MKDRIREVRNINNLTQSKFAESLGLKQATITAYECGSRVPTDRAIQDICRVYGISEEWLKTGAGSMHTANSEKARLYAWAMDTLTGGDPFLIRLLDELSKLPPEQIEAVKGFLKRVIDDREN